MFDDINKEESGSGNANKPTPPPIPMQSAPMPPAPPKEDTRNEPNDILSDVNTGAPAIPTFNEVRANDSLMSQGVKKKSSVKKIIIILVILILLIPLILAVYAIVNFYLASVSTTIPDENIFKPNPAVETTTETTIPETTTPETTTPDTTIQDDTQPVVAEESNADIDTDGDGLTDVIEIQIGTDINSIDSDDDGLTDFEEINIYFTNPLNADTDNDTYLDGTEVANGYNPNGAGLLVQ